MRFALMSRSTALLPFAFKAFIAVAQSQLQTPIQIAPKDPTQIIPAIVAGDLTCHF